MYDPIAYTYEADHHCEGCAEARFGRDENSEINGEDSEGNPVGAVAPWDEWWETSEDACQTLVCGTCQSLIATVHREECEHGYGEEPCSLPEHAIA